MQERWFGDAHDFATFALLRHLQRALGVRVGINCYLAPPEANGDGENRAFPDDPAWRAWDTGLAAAPEPFRDPARRALATFPGSGLLPVDTRSFAGRVVQVLAGF
jgi:hypothetical protein